MRDDAVRASRKLLSSPNDFHQSILVLLSDHAATVAHFIDCAGVAHRSFFGQAACFAHHGATAQETCAAWWQLSAGERNRANNIADQALEIWNAKKRTDIERVFRDNGQIAMDV